MNDNNNFDDIEFIDLSDTSEENNTPVSEYHTEQETNDIFEEAASDAERRAAIRARRKRMRKRKLLIRRCVFAVALVTFLVSSIFLISALLEYNHGDKIYNDLQETIFMNSGNSSNSTNKPGSGGNGTTGTGTSNTPEESDEHVLLTNYNHESLIAINADSIGYLQIPALDILLPVVHGDDNSYYLTHALTGEESKNGTLFIDARNTEGIESQNTIIYGHNMKNGSMFAPLKKFMDSDFFNKGNNRFFYVYVDEYIYKYEIYAVHITPSVGDTYTTHFDSGAKFLEYVNNMSKASYHSTNLTFAEDSKTITFSTCTNDDSTRLVVQALRIEEIPN